MKGEIEPINLTKIVEIQFSDLVISLIFSRFDSISKFGKNLKSSQQIRSKLKCFKQKSLQKCLEMRIRSILQVILILIGVFLASFLTVFLVIYLTPSPYLHERAYSIPPRNERWGSSVPDTGNSIGPGLNATNVPLDTTVIIDQMRPFYIGELKLSPEVPIASRVDEDYWPASRFTIFYFSEPLKPSTTFNATLFVVNQTISWNFTTTTEPYHPRYEAMPSELGMYITVITSAIVTSVVGLTIWKKKNAN